MCIQRNSDQPGHPPSLIRVFDVRMKNARVLSYPPNERIVKADQTGRMPRLIWVFAGRTVILLVSSNVFLFLFYFFFFFIFFFFFSVTWYSYFKTYVKKQIWDNCSGMDYRIISDSLKSSLLLVLNWSSRPLDAYLNWSLNLVIILYNKRLAAFKMSHVMRKPVFGDLQLVKTQPGRVCWLTETSKNLGMLHR